MLRKLIAILFGFGLLCSLLFVAYGLMKLEREDTLKQKAGAELSKQLQALGFQGQVQIQSTFDYRRVVVASLTSSGLFLLALLGVLFFWPSTRRKRAEEDASSTAPSSIKVAVSSLATPIQQPATNPPELEAASTSQPPEPATSALQPPEAVSTPQPPANSLPPTHPSKQEDASPAKQEDASPAPAKEGSL